MIDRVKVTVRVRVRVTAMVRVRIKFSVIISDRVSVSVRGIHRARRVHRSWHIRFTFIWATLIL